MAVHRTANATVGAQAAQARSRQQRQQDLRLRGMTRLFSNRGPSIGGPHCTPASDRYAPGHFDDCAVDIARLVGGEPGVGVGDLFGSSEPA